MKNLDNYIIKNKKVLFRADFNVPLVNGKISDDSRIIAVKKSIQKLIKQKNKVFIVSHFGRPNGKINKKYSLKFICPTLKKVLQLNKLYFLETLNSEQIANKINEVLYGEVCLLENIRFSPSEEEIDLNLTNFITKHFDVYVNDAFSASHRNHMSITGFPKYLPAVAGDNFIKEMQNINLFLDNGKKPNTAVIGGAKISTKIELLNNLIELFDTVAVGGAMANTFLLSNNIKVGNSLVEKDLIDVALDIQNKAKKFNCNFILPTDVVCSNNNKTKNNIRHCNVKNVSPDHMILDVGQKTIKMICDEILKSRMVLWNGPLGAFEYKPFDSGTIEMVNLINKYAKNMQIKVLAGGGDTLSSIKSAGSAKGFTYVSNAGGAFLEWLKGNESPGVKALKENNI